MKVTRKNHLILSSQEFQLLQYIAYKLNFGEPFEFSEDERSLPAAVLDVFNIRSRI